MLAFLLLTCLLTSTPRPVQFVRSQMFEKILEAEATRGGSRSGSDSSSDSSGYDTDASEQDGIAVAGSSGSTSRRRHLRSRRSCWDKPWIRTFMDPDMGRGSRSGHSRTVGILLRRADLASVTVTHADKDGVRRPPQLRGLFAAFGAPVTR